MNASRASIAFSASLLFAACTQGVGGSNGMPGAPVVGSAGTEGAAAGACAGPKLVMSTPSPFADALDAWSRSPLGDAAALAALEAACDDAADSARGTEHAACVLLGLAYSAGEGVPKNALRSLAYLERGAQCSFSFRAHDLAQAPNQSIHLSSVACCAGVGCSSGCESECARAEAALAAAYVPPLERACRAGRAVGCFMLAQLVGEHGEYVARIGSVHAPATIGARGALLERSCSKGLGIACEELAFGVAEDDPGERLRLLGRACDLGWGGACRHVAERTTNARARLAVWERACKLGLHHVCSELAQMYAKGEEGAPVDHEKASAMEAETWRLP